MASYSEGSAGLGGPGGLGGLRTDSGVRALPLLGCVTQGNSLHLSEPCLLSL